MTTIGAASREATDLYGTYVDGPPALTLCGIRPVDAAIGGMSPSTTLVLAADSKVGKSTRVLQAAWEAEDQRPSEPHCILSAEDPRDVWGVRAISLETGIDNRRIRLKQVTSDEVRRIKLAQARIDKRKLQIRPVLGMGHGEIEAEMDEAHDQGARMFWFDYIQKAGRGDEPRHSIVQFMRWLQGKCAALSVPLGIVSQITPRTDPRTGRQIQEPQPNWLRECKDLGIEARVLVMYWIEGQYVWGKMAYSTYGGAGVRWRERRTGSGMLEYVDGAGVSDELFPEGP